MSRGNAKVSLSTRSQSRYSVHWKSTFCTKPSLAWTKPSCERKCPFTSPPPAEFLNSKRVSEPCWLMALVRERLCFYRQSSRFFFLPKSPYLNFDSTESGKLTCNYLKSTPRYSYRKFLIV